MAKKICFCYVYFITIKNKNNEKSEWGNLFKKLLKEATQNSDLSRNSDDLILENLSIVYIQYV